MKFCISLLDDSPNLGVYFGFFLWDPPQEFFFLDLPLATLLKSEALMLCDLTLWCVFGCLIFIHIYFSLSPLVLRVGVGHHSSSGWMTTRQCGALCWQCWVACSSWALSFASTSSTNSKTRQATKKPLKSGAFIMRKEHTHYEQQSTIWVCISGGRDPTKCSSVIHY